MAQIARTLDENGNPSFNYGTTLELLAEELLDERCLIFLGAGASIDQTNEDLPTAKELSKEMASKCSLEWHEYVPMSTVAYYYEFFFTRAKLNRFLDRRIADPKIQPSSTIRTLIQIIKHLERQNKKCFVVTTNYDRHFENAYEEEFDGPPGVIVYNGANDPNRHTKLHEGIEGDSEYWLPKSLTYLYKMHGCISDPGERNLVITEEDYINFLTNSLSQDPGRRLLHYVKGRIALSTILFIGYSMTDWNFRVIFKATAEDQGRTSFAVQLNSPPQDNHLEQARQAALVKFWGERKIDIVNSDAAEFMKDLLKNVKDSSLLELTQSG